jgi:cytochrome oxidase Cu insertion factor (SCO1/SenC/PrrC family)
VNVSLPVAEPAPAASPERSRRLGRVKMLAILLVCAAPVIASYLAYYVVRPSGLTNYGELIEPQRPAGGLAGRTASGDTVSLATLQGRWVMLAADAGPCEKACTERLWMMRQVRATTGKDMERIERVLALTGEGAPAASLLAEHEGLRVLRVDAGALQALLPARAGEGGAQDHVWLIDPNGNLMMRFPRDADPNRVKKDVAKLLRASRIG